jgi:hypothetical protein
MLSNFPSRTLRSQTLFQFAGKNIRCQSNRALPGDNENIGPWRQLGAAAPEKFSQLPFNPIADH